jgi:MFS family permease
MVSVVGGLACLAAMFLDGIPQLLAVALIGGTMMPLYSLSVAHTNDYLQPSQMVAASSSMILMSGTAAIAGPILASLWMRYTGFGGFFLFIGSSLLLVAAFAIYRSLRGRAARPPSV